MLKAFCDICDDLIKPQDENGKLVYIEKTFQLLKNKQEPAIRQTELIFCEKCIRGLRQYIHGQRDVQKK
jgi:hypothetical protein